MTPGQVYHLSGATQRARSGGGDSADPTVAAHGIPGAELGSPADLAAMAGTPLRG